MGRHFPFTTFHVFVFVFASVKVQREEGFHVDLDDYLMGLLQLAGELVSAHVDIKVARSSE